METIVLSSELGRKNSKKTFNKQNLFLICDTPFLIHSPTTASWGHHTYRLSEASGKGTSRHPPAPIFSLMTTQIIAFDAVAQKTHLPDGHSVKPCPIPASTRGAWHIITTLSHHHKRAV